MTDQANKGAAGVATVIVIIIVIIGLIMANWWLQRQASEIASSPVSLPAQVPAVKPSPEKKAPKPRTGEVIRKTRFSPDRKYENNVFYQGGVEIARNKTSNGNVYDQTGEIPDGKVKFINESNETYGVEYYRDQKRHGPAVIYYSDGAVKQEIHYQFGKPVTSTEYYHDGTAKMKVDYTNARDSLDGNKEVGIGKIYHRDGILKYEWHLTVTEPVGFKKTYNTRGELVTASYYDEYGQPIESTGAAASAPGGVPPASESLTATDMPAGPAGPTDSYRPPKQIFIPVSQ